MFSNSTKGKGGVPCVGISFGVDRIFSITKARMAGAAVRGNEVDVYVMAFGVKGFTGLVKERMEICRILWDAGIKATSLSFILLNVVKANDKKKAEFMYKTKPKLPPQFSNAEKNGVPFAVVLGQEEMKKGTVKIKELGLPEGHPEKNGVEVLTVDLVKEVTRRLEEKAKGAAGLGPDVDG